MIDRRGRLLRLGLLLLGVVALCLAVGALYRHGLGRMVDPQDNPPLGTAPAPWPTPRVARAFSFPLRPQESYGPYVQGVTGPRAIDTSFASQNPALGGRRTCFRDREGNPVPFRDLHHAGVDLFALGGEGGVAWGEATHVPVRAVADGVAVATLSAGTEGQIVITEHRLAQGDHVYSVYWHVSRLQVRPGQPVTRGQAIGVIHDQGFNSHLHWEMRTFRDGTSLFAAGTAGARGTCNGHIAGVGYTWDDEPARAGPRFYGYADPITFVEEHQP